DKDNFWQMGDTGPCGPCSEMLVDIRSTERGARSRNLALDEFVRLSEEGQLLEIWNLVFMQYDQQPDASRIPLPAPSVDTGAGLERISAVMQNVPSNFDTDLFQPIIAQAVEIVGRPYDRGPSGAPYRVLADHARAVAFLLADGAARADARATHPRGHGRDGRCLCGAPVEGAAHRAGHPGRRGALPRNDRGGALPPGGAEGREGDFGRRGIQAVRHLWIPDRS